MTFLLSLNLSLIFTATQDSTGSLLPHDTVDTSIFLRYFHTFPPIQQVPPQPTSVSTTSLIVSYFLAVSQSSSYRSHIFLAHEDHRFQSGVCNALTKPGNKLGTSHGVVMYFYHSVTLYPTLSDLYGYVLLKIE